MTEAITRGKPLYTPIYDLVDLQSNLGISVRTLREYIKRGDLKARKVGRAYYVTEPNLLAFLEAS